jgi:integrase
MRDWLRKQSPWSSREAEEHSLQRLSLGASRGVVPTDCDPVKDVGAPTISDCEAVHVTAQQAFAILDEIEPPLVRCLVILLSATGLRPSEALALKWSNLDFEQGTIRIENGFVDGEINDPKSLASRGRVEVHKALAAVMLEWRKKTSYAAASDFVFA